MEQFRIGKEELLWIISVARLENGSGWMENGGSHTERRDQTDTKPGKESTSQEKWKRGRGGLENDTQVKDPA